MSVITLIPIPEGTSFTDELVRRFEPWLTQDLKDYVEVIASMFDEVVLYAFDTEEHEGWTILFDPQRIPAKDLPFLAQVVGENLPIGLTESAAREWIEDAPNNVRGTPRSVFLAAQRKLTGDRLVTMRERSGAVDELTIFTYTDQTPDPDGTLRDLESVVSSDVVLTYEVRDGQTWDDVQAAYPTWNDLMTPVETPPGSGNFQVPTWADIYSGLAGESHFPRPRPELL